MIRLFSAFFTFLPIVLGRLAIVPGATWTVPETGDHLQAHGTGIIKVDEYYYAVGENKTKTPTNPTGSKFNSVACYRSMDLASWEFVNNPLSNSMGSATGIYQDLQNSSIVERPKIIYNEATKKYVMWFHSDRNGYGYARAAVAVSDSVCGNYTYLGSQRPFGNVSRDMGLFVDDDGAGYLLSEDRLHGSQVYRLTDDYLNVSSIVHTFNADLEAPAMIKKDGVYFFFGSYLTGWSTNDNSYATATNISGPWTNFTNFAPVGSKTYNSQTTFVLPVGNSFVYMGDRWLSSTLWASKYIWLPLSINSKNRTAKLTWYDHWSIDVSSGEVSSSDSTTYGIVGDPDTVATTGSISVQTLNGTEVIGPVGGAENSTLTFKNLHITSENDGTLRFNYTNLSGNTVYANISVGGRAMQTISFLATATGEVGISVWQYLHRLSCGNVMLSGSIRGGNGTMIAGLTT